MPRWSNKLLKRGPYDEQPQSLYLLRDDIKVRPGVYLPTRVIDGMERRREGFLACRIGNRLLISDRLLIGVRHNRVAIMCSEDSYCKECAYSLEKSTEHGMTRYFDPEGDHRQVLFCPDCDSPLED